MASLHSPVMMGHVPLYLNGSLSYISSRSFRPSPTLEPSDPILNTASILLSLHSLPSEGLELSTSPVSPRRPRHFPWPRSPRQRRLSKFIISSPPSTSPPLCNSILHSFLFAHHLHFFLSYTLPLFPLINRRLMNSIDHRIVRLRRHRDRCLRILTTRCPAIEAALGSVWFKQYLGRFYVRAGPIISESRYSPDQNNQK